MHLLLNLLRSHGPWALFTAAFLESVGIPLPAGIFLILSGCLVIEGTVSLPGALAAAVAGALAGDLHWFMIGRLKGRGALRVLCRLSLNPDACMGRTENLFRSRTVLSILTAKLVPGLNTVIAPLAGILGFETRPLVSADYCNDTRSSIVDGPSTMVTDGTLLKVYAWYDNEIGYVCRMVDLGVDRAILGILAGCGHGLGSTEKVSEDIPDPRKQVHRA